MLLKFSGFFCHVSYIWLNQLVTYALKAPSHFKSLISSTVNALKRARILSSLHFLCLPLFCPIQVKLIDINSASLRSYLLTIYLYFQEKSYGCGKLFLGVILVETHRGLSKSQVNNFPWRERGYWGLKACAELDLCLAVYIQTKLIIILEFKTQYVSE